MKIFVPLLLTFLNFGCLSRTTPTSQIAIGRDLPRSLVVRFKGEGDRRYIATFLESGTVGMAYRIRGSEPKEILKIPFKNQETLFDAEVTLFTDPKIRETLGDLLVESRVKFITEIDDEPAFIRVLVKEEVVGKHVKDIKVSAFEDSFKELFERLRTLAREHQIIIEDLHEQNVMITDEVSPRVRIIDGSARRAASEADAQYQFIAACNDWTWCRKFALSQIGESANVNRCRRLSELFQIEP